MPNELLIPTLGADYVYTGLIPAGCKGHLYRVHRFVMDVPAYQHKVLCEALTGPDKGLWFVCSLANFSVRYEEVKEPCRRSDQPGEATCPCPSADTAAPSS